MPRAPARRARQREGDAGSSDAVSPSPSGEGPQGACRAGSLARLGKTGRRGRPEKADGRLGQATRSGSTTPPIPEPRGSEAASTRPSGRRWTAWTLAVCVLTRMVWPRRSSSARGLGREGVGLGLQPVGEPLVVEARAVEGGLQGVAVHEQVEQHLDDVGGDARAAAAAQGVGLVPLPGDHRRHRGEHPLAGRHGVGLPLDQPEEVGLARGGGEVVHLVVEEEARAGHPEPAAEEVVEGGGEGHQVAVARRRPRGGSSRCRRPRACRGPAAARRARACTWAEGVACWRSIPAARWAIQAGSRSWAAVAWVVAGSPSRKRSAKARRKASARRWSRSAPKRGSLAQPSRSSIPRVWPRMMPPEEGSGIVASFQPKASRVSGSPPDRLVGGEVGGGEHAAVARARPPRPRRRPGRW